CRLSYGSLSRPRAGRIINGDSAGHFAAQYLLCARGSKLRAVAVLSFDVLLYLTVPSAGTRKILWGWVRALPVCRLLYALSRLFRFLVSSPLCRFAKGPHV